MKLNEMLSIYPSSKPQSNTHDMGFWAVLVPILTGALKTGSDFYAQSEMAKKQGDIQKRLMDREANARAAEANHEITIGEMEKDIAKMELDAKKEVTKVQVEAEVNKVQIQQDFQKKIIIPIAIVGGSLFVLVLGLGVYLIVRKK